MFRKLVFIVICAILLWQAFSFLNEAAAQAQDRTPTKPERFWTQLLKAIQAHPFASSIITVTLITIVSTILAMVKKDKILRSLKGHLITIELKEGNRYRGRLRVESEGLEVVAEKADEAHEKVSYLIRKDEYPNIHALVHYHDFLTDKEKEERKAEVNRVYHPSISMRLRRKARNIVNEMRRVATEAFTLAFGKVRESFNIKAGGQYAEEMESKGKEAVGYVTEAAYDALIDRLIGTRVVAYIKKDLEYVGVLKNYTSQFIELLDVNYKNAWGITIERDDVSKHDRGLILEKDGKDVIIRSKSPFRMKLRHIFWNEDRPNAERKDINAIIEPFGEIRISLMPPALDLTVGPFEKLQLPIGFHYQEYKKINFHFESVRIADIVLLKNYGIVRHRTEKYEPRLLDFGALADALLTNKVEGLSLKGNPSAPSLTIYNGYITNLPRERMDTLEVDVQCSQRWMVDSSFTMLDKKLRPISNHYFLGFLPLRKPRKIVALLALLATIHSDEKRKKDPLLPLIYFSLLIANFRKQRQLHKNQVLIRKRKRLLGFLSRHSHA